MDAMLVATSFWTGTIGSTLLMLIGFGLVVFVHELGHFAVAKWVGIRVDEFALGFGKKIWSLKRGETEYRLNLLPLGGYVKMAGQEDFALKEQEETDPRAYNNKPIWARLCVVSAGVIMNVILAGLLFFAVFRVGKDYSPAVVGRVTAGYPASKVELPGDLGTGLKPGDVIERIDGDEVRKFDALRIEAILSDADEEFTFQIRRPGVDEPFDVTLSVAPGVSMGRRSRIFGIGPAIDRVLADDAEVAASLKHITGGALVGGDTIVSIAGEPIAHGWQIQAMTLPAASAEIVVERTDPATGKTTRHTATVPTLLTWSEHLMRRINEQGLADDTDPPFKIPRFNVLGLQPRMYVAGVLKGSAAEKAGIRIGDVIAAYGPAADVPTVERLRDISDANAGGPVPVRILRDGDITPEVTHVEVPGGDRPTVGISSTFDQTHLVVAGVLSGTPLADAIPIGAAITAVNGAPVTTWSNLVDAVGAISGEEATVVLSYDTPAGGTEQTEPIALATFGFDALDYEYGLDLSFEELSKLRKETNPWAAMELGVQETGDFIVLTYATLHGFFAGRVSGSDFSGPIGIFRTGIAVGERGVIWVVWLLAIISANLAVINFLPLPIVDGGLAVMLVIEKVRGKPLSVTVQNAIQVVGLVLIAVLFVLLTYNDIRQWIGVG